MNSIFEINLYGTENFSEISSYNNLLELFEKQVEKYLGPQTSGQNFTEYIQKKGTKEIDFHYGLNKIFLGINTEENRTLLIVTINDSSAFSSKKLFDFCELLQNYLPNFHFTANNRSIESNIWKGLAKINPDYSPIYFAFLGSAAWYTKYAPKKFRDKRFLVLNDEFFLKIPAEIVNVDSQGAIKIIFYKETEPDIDKAIEATEKVVQYYIKKIKEIDIWKKVLLNSGWKEKYKDILVEKGLY